MHKYKVRTGRHIDEHGNLHEKGQVVITDRNLLEQFPHKFEDLGPVEETPKSKKPANKSVKPAENPPGNPASAPKATKTAKAPAKAPKRARGQAKGVPATAPGKGEDPPTQDADDWEE